MTNKASALIIMGVSGSGKTTVGKRLSRKLAWPFYDGDDFHPEENRAKMAAGIALDDDDRAPWLASLNRLIAEHLSKGESMLLACSALKQSYGINYRWNPGVIFVYLNGSYDLILERLKDRADHYMKAEMLMSQFETLEKPDDGLTIDISHSPEDILAEIIAFLASAR